MKVTFKDVGQGDSVILEWLDGGLPKIGIIDCSKKGRLNPVLEHIVNCKCNEIEFIILSHAHADHYSGFIELFEYLKARGIIIKSFIHTLHYIGAQYFKWCEIDTEDSRILVKLIEEMDQLEKAGTILKIENVTENWRLDLASDIYLKCLSPSNEEAKLYQRAVEYEPEVNKKAASRASNFLATVWKLTIEDKYYLFTSDGEKSTFERLLRQNRHRNLSLKNLALCQLPHHGSIKNHFPEFWASLTKDSSALYAVASAGVNQKYRHPNFEVLECFHNEGYSVHCTNIVNGMKEYVELLKSLAEKSSVLDTGSSLAEEYMEANDRVFTLYNGKFKLQES